MKLETDPTKGRTIERSGFAEEQIFVVLVEHKAGESCADLSRMNAMSEGSFYNRKAKLGGMTVSDVKRLKELGDQSARLKKLLAEQMLEGETFVRLRSEDNGRAQQGNCRHKAVRPAAKRAAVAHLQARMGLSERRACQVAGAGQKVIRYRSVRAPEKDLRDLTNERSELERHRPE